ncbi:ATP-binding protein [Arthrospiribacter ruber]|uniref:ATP-binding protein n=1 Tax=Arthrospiribacter ruber TaxID=2487934 RepID=A0A951J5W0_9BACT|nr:ATP-binding protein [Arthrospiribacter ruber]MBW3470088.1 ATP-binding protein [Arthrospiribacter ruber]
MKFERSIQELIQKKFFLGKAIVLLGPRQAGKTTLIETILKGREEKFLYLDGDDSTVREILEQANTETLRAIIADNKIVYIDEAQRISAIGLQSKIIVDQFKHIQLVLSGSSAFELNEKIQEPLTGRKWTFHLWPIAWQEYEKEVGYLKAEQSLENRLVYGFYPNVITDATHEEEVLLELTESYLYKDVLIYGNLKKPKLVRNILEALAYQVGNEVKYKELGETVGADPKTVASYIDVLEKAFVVFSLSSYSNNLRTEIKTAKKIYFYDNGVRNAVIRDFTPMAARQDVGALWENFLISERLKANTYTKSLVRIFFWRTKQQQEIDYVEELAGKLHAYEFKWNPKRKVNFPKTFTETYQSQNQIVNRGNFRDFVKVGVF